MGCDIHAFLEYSSDGKFWRNLVSNGGERDYLMFGIVAGVRAEDQKLFDPKGMPEGNLGWQTHDAYWLKLTPVEHPNWADRDGWVSPEKAKDWVERGLSVWCADSQGRTRWVSDPDAHSASWLTTDEVGQAIERYKAVAPAYYEGKAPTDWLAMHAAMMAIAVNGDYARLVFWFDN